MWTDIFEHYSSRSLTVASDRLPALSGIASHFKQILPKDEYMFGLWKTALGYGLLWSIICDAGHEYELKSRPDWREVPSWSWGSVRGRVHWASFDKRLPNEYEMEPERATSIMEALESPTHLPHTALCVTGWLTRMEIEEGVTIFDERTPILAHSSWPKGTIEFEDSNKGFFLFPA